MITNIGTAMVLFPIARRRRTAAQPIGVSTLGTGAKLRSTLRLGTRRELVPESRTTAVVPTASLLHTRPGKSPVPRATAGRAGKSGSRV